MRYHENVTRTRARLIVFAGLVVGAVWMASLTVQPLQAANAPAKPKVELRPLTANELAGILQINTWCFDYTNAVVQCWVEVEGTGGKEPVKFRIPDTGYVGYNAGKREGAWSSENPTHGNILLWWQRSPDWKGGQIEIRVNNSSAGRGTAATEFVWGLQSFGASATPQTTVPMPGQELVLVKFHAKGEPSKGNEDGPREIVLNLKAKFLDPKTLPR